MSLTIS